MHQPFPVRQAAHTLVGVPTVFAISPAGGCRVSVEQRVIDIVCEQLAVAKETVTRSTSFQDDIGADSLDIVELVMELEEEFDIQIPDTDAEKIKTVGEAIDYIEKKKAAGEGKA
jgi:acyl carrier protein